MMLFFFILVPLFSCSIPSSKKVVSNTHLLSVIDSVTVELDNSTAGYWRIAQYYKQKDQDFIVFQDAVSTDPDYVSFFDLSKKKIAFKLTLRTSGPNGVGKPMSFYVHNLDSIFVLSSYSYTVFLMDTSGAVKNQYKLIRNGIDDDSAMPFTQTTASMFVANDSLFIPTIPDVDPYATNYKKQNLLIGLDLKTHEFKYKIGFSELYNNSYWVREFTFVSFAYNAQTNELIINYPIDPNIHFISLDKRRIGEVKSDYIDNDMSRTAHHKETNDRKERLQFQLGTDKFDAVYYDPYRNLYYRVCLQKYDDESIKTMIGGGKGKSSLSTVIVFTDKFEKIGEQVFENGSYFLDPFIITDEGILLKKNTNQEDQVVFHLFRVDR